MRKQRKLSEQKSVKTLTILCKKNNQKSLFQLHPSTYKFDIFSNLLPKWHNHNDQLLKRTPKPAGRTKHLRTTLLKMAADLLGEFRASASSTQISCQCLLIHKHKLTLFLADHHTSFSVSMHMKNLVLYQVTSK